MNLGSSGSIQDKPSLGARMMRAAKRNTSLFTVHTVVKAFSMPFSIFLPVRLEVATRERTWAHILRLFSIYATRRFKFKNTHTKSIIFEKIPEITRRVARRIDIYYIDRYLTNSPPTTPFFIFSLNGAQCQAG
jgi:hypothetical protein